LDFGESILSRLEGLWTHPHRICATSNTFYPKGCLSRWKFHPVQRNYWKHLPQGSFTQGPRRGVPLLVLVTNKINDGDHAVLLVGHGDEEKGETSEEKRERDCVRWNNVCSI